MAEEITSDMLPDTQPDSAAPVEQPVSQDVKQPASESPGPIEDAPAETESKVPQGHVPYSRFKEVNQKLKEAEEKLKDLQASETPEDEVEAEENPLAEKVTKLERELYLNRFPELNDKRDELESYLEENSNLNLEQGVKLFRAEYGLDTPPARKGLQPVNAGPKTAPTARFTKEDVENMRDKDPDKWLKHSMAGDFDEVAKWR